jgi:hypothetical protein
MNSLRDKNKLFATTLHRYHMVIFIVAVFVGLMAAVLLLNGIILKTSTTTTPDSTKASFDQTTIDRIKQLKTSSEPSTPLDLSKGRISPFSE